MVPVPLFIMLLSIVPIFNLSRSTKFKVSGDTGYKVARATGLRSNGRGFTLIEIMVAVAIFALIAAITFPALIQFLDIRDRINKKNASLDSLQKTFLFMSRDLSYAVNRLGKDDYGDELKTTLVVDDDSLIELTSASQDFALGGVSVPRRLKWLLEDGVLYRMQYPVMDPDGDSKAYRQALLTEVDDVQLTLFSIEDGRDSESKKWNEKTRLPNMIQVLVEMNNGLEYTRKFTMLGNDTEQAIKSASVTPISPSP